MKDTIFILDNAYTIHQTNTMVPSMGSICSKECKYFQKAFDIGTENNYYPGKILSHAEILHYNSNNYCL